MNTDDWNELMDSLRESEQVWNNPFKMGEIARPARIHYRHEIGALEAMLAKEANVFIEKLGHWEVICELQFGGYGRGDEPRHEYGLRHLVTGQMASLVQAEDLLALELYKGDDFSQPTDTKMTLDTKDVKWMVEV